MNLRLEMPKRHGVVKQCLWWKPIQAKSRSGRDVYVRTPEILATRYRGRLLAEILAMPAKASISFSDAVRLLVVKQCACFDADLISDAEGHYGWYEAHFVDWISEQGFHIELTGDEFEPYQMSDKLL